WSGRASTRRRTGWRPNAGAGPIGSIGSKDTWTSRKGWMTKMGNLRDTGALDREIVLARLLSHPRDKVFAAWMDAEALAEWYGPAGLRIETHEADIREGGLWRFDMVGEFEGRPQRFPNLMRFLEIVPNERIVIDYGTPEPE